MPSLQTELQSKSTGTNVFKALAYTIIPNYNTQMIKKTTKPTKLQAYKKLLLYHSTVGVTSH